MRQAATSPIRITLEGSAGQDELRSLVGWLRAHRDVGPYATVSVGGLDPSAAPSGDPMGTLATVQLVVDAGLQTGGLVVAIMAWREAHKANARLTLGREGRPPAPLPEPDAGPDEIDLTARRLADEA